MVLLVWVRWNLYRGPNMAIPGQQVGCVRILNAPVRKSFYNLHMPNYRRIYGGNAYYFTLVTDHRIPILTTEQARAGLRSYNVEVREGAGEWSRWLTETTQMQADFGGEDGKQYTFRVQGVDRVGNAGAWLETATATTYAVTKYYAMAGQRVAMRQGSSVSYLYGDHLPPSGVLRCAPRGSTSLVKDASGVTETETRYQPYAGRQPIAKR